MHLEAIKSESRAILERLKSFSDFYLGGGTALALQVGHRVSVDFDLFCGQKLPTQLLADVEKVFAGQPVAIEVNNANQLSVKVATTQITFLCYPFPLLEQLVDFNGLKILSVSEITATKAYTIGRRATFKDYVDLYFVLKERHADLKQIIVLAEKKYAQAFNARLFLEQLLYLDDIAETPLTFLGEPVSLKQLAEFFTKVTKSFEL